MTERVELLEPACEYRSDAIEGQFRVDAEDLFGILAGEFLRGKCAEAAVHFGYIGGRHGEPDGECVSSKTGVEVGTGFDGFEQLEAIDRSA